MGVILFLLVGYVCNFEDKSVFCFQVNYGSNGLVVEWHTFERGFFSFFQSPLTLFLLLVFFIG